MTRICMGCGEAFETEHTAQYCDTCKNEGVKFKCADCDTPSSISWEKHRNRRHHEYQKQPRCTTCYDKYASTLFDESNNTFGALTVIRMVDSIEPGVARWLCRCECGVEREYNGNYLRRYKRDYVCKHKKKTKSRTVQ